MKKSLGIFTFCFLVLFSPRETEAGIHCIRWMKRAAFVLSKPVHPLLFHHTSLDEMGSKKFFREKSTPRFWALEDYILAHPPAVLDSSVQKRILDAIQTYRYSNSTQLTPFDPQKANETYGREDPELHDVLNFFMARAEDIRKDLSRSNVYHARRPVQFTLRYKWLLLGTTVFVLWDPIQAEIRSVVYWMFNGMRDVFHDSEDIREKSKEIGELLSLVKSELRNLYFTTNDEYPTTMQMSRNNLNYLYDVILKRRSDLSIAAMTNDDRALEWNLLYLYLIPYLYRDMYGSPLSGLLREILTDTFERFDPNGKYEQIFETRIREYFSSQQPDSAD